MNPGWLGAMLWTVMSVDPRVAAMADRLHEALLNEGRIVEDPVAERWCRALLGENGSVRLSFLDDPEPRAFAYPDGRIYLSSGLFLAVRNSAQLLFVLAHEAAHLTAEADGLNAHDGAYPIELERRADAAAVSVLQQRGIAPDAAAGALLGLAAQAASLDRPVDDEQFADRLAAMPVRAAAPDALEPRSALDPAVGGIKALALHALLDRGRTEPAGDCLAGPCADDLDANERQFLNGRHQLLLGRATEAVEWLRPLSREHAVDPAVHRALAVAELTIGDRDAARGAWTRLLRSDPPDRRLIRDWLSGQPPAAPPSPVAPIGPLHRFSGLVLRLPDDWWRLASDHGSLRFSRDGATIQIFSIGLSDRSSDSDPLLELHRWLIEIRKRYAPRNLRWLEASTFRNSMGLRVVLGYRDRLGLDWRLSLYRFAVDDRTVEAAFQAPRLHYFQRDLAIVEAALTGLAD